MAELGVASGVAGLLSLVFDVIQVAGKYIHAVSASNRSVLDVLDILTSLQAIFIRFQKQVNNVGLEAIVGARSQALSSTAMAACEKRLRELQTVLKGYLNDEGHLKKRHALAWPFRSDQTKDLLDSLGRHRDIFHAALSADILDVSLSTHQKVADHQASDRLHAVVDWLCPLGTSTPQRLDVEVDTSIHIRADQNFQNWLATPGNILWCYGDAGCGKTVLVSMLYRDWVSISNTRHPLVHFYDYRNVSTQSADSVARSFLAQVIQMRGVLPPEVETLYNNAKTRNQQPSKSLMSDTLTRVLKSFPGAIILVDGFDECHYRSENLLLLRSVAAAGTCVLITSRKMPDIENLFQKYNRMKISPNDTDIRSLIKTRIGEIEDDLELDEAFKRKINDEIVSQCGGIFLLVKLTLDDLTRATSKKELRQALKRLPGTLPEMYRKILDQIKRSKHASLANRVTKWVVHAGRPLHIQELQHGLATEPSTFELDEDNLITKVTIVSSCLGMITLDQDGTVRPIHTSAFEFLSSDDSQTTKAIHTDLSVACLSYLSFKTLAAGPCLDSDELEDRIRNHPFALYAAQYLGFHCRYVEDEFLKQLVGLLSDEGTRTSAMQLFHHQRIKDDALRREAFSLLPKGQTALQVACGLGLACTSKRLVDMGHDVSAADFQGWRPLNTAASYGHKDIVKMLLDSGADLECQDVHKWTPLIWSVLKGHIDVAQELLTAGADISTSDDSGWTAMHWAASIGEPKMIAILSAAWDKLFKHGKAVSRGPDERLNPLIIAVDNSNITALDSLIDVHSKSFCPLPSQDGLFRFLTKKDRMIKRVDVGGPGVPSLVFPKNFAAKVLDSAIRSAHLSMVKLLIERGIAKDTYREYNGRGPLHTAVFCATPEIPCLLANHGYDIGAIDTQGYSVLDTAARNSTVEVIKNLLDFPVAALGIKGGRTSPLHQIWSNSRLLLNHGVKPLPERRQYERDPEYTTQEARQMQQRLLYTQFDIADSFLGMGADINKLDGAGQSPVFHALSSGVEAVKFLETRGAMMNVADSAGNTLLHCCIEEELRHKDDFRARFSATNLIGREQSQRLAQMMIDYGVQVDARNGEGYTALHYAARQASSRDLMKFLIDHGGDVDARNNAGHTALHYAGEYGTPAELSLLLDHGADPTLTTKSNETPLHTVASIYAWTKNSMNLLMRLRLLIDRCEPDAFTNPCDGHDTKADFRIEDQRRGISCDTEELKKHDKGSDTHNDLLSKIERKTKYLDLLTKYGNNGSPLAFALVAGNFELVEELQKDGTITLS